MEAEAARADAAEENDPQRLAAQSQVYLLESIVARAEEQTERAGEKVEV
jgi:hypothetical protein